MKLTYHGLEKELKKYRNPYKAEISQRFFKTGKGEYGEGDIFLGLTVPQQRQIAKKFTNLTLDNLQKTLSSKIHEFRLTALIILASKYKKANLKEKKGIVDFYLKNTKVINNWDLVDLSAPKILGDWLLDKDESVLYQLAKSKNLWKRRIAIMSTFAFICQNRFEETLKIAEVLLNDRYDLIHKAVGWMLREIGKRDLAKEDFFLKKHFPKMPRVMLLYAIEKFPDSRRKFYLRRQ